MNKIKTSEPKPLWKLRCTLGEGTLWVSEHNSIYFVDIKKKKICSFNIKNKKKKIFKVNKEIGFIAHIKDYIFILGLQGELRIQNLKSKKILKSIKIEPNLKLNRINDGKTDPAGNLWFGTMDNLERKIEKGSLYKLDKNLKLIKVDKNYRITNGPAFIDQYNFCEVLGKSGKEPMLAFRELSIEDYLGGAGAIANHLSSFCKKIKLLSMLGEKEEYKKLNHCY